MYTIVERREGEVPGSRAAGFDETEERANGANQYFHVGPAVPVS